MFLIKPYFVQQSPPPTRASTATYTDAGGVLRYAAIDEPRPIIEETGSTNIVNYSSDIAQYGTPSGSLTESSSQGPDLLSSSAIKITSTAGTAVRYAQSETTNLFSLVNTKTYSCSVYVKNNANVSHVRFARTKGGDDKEYIHVNLTTGQLSNSSGILSGSFYTESLGNNWFRIGFSIVASNGTDSAFRLYMCSNAVNTNYTPPTSPGELSFFGFQVEEGNLSSYIPTTGAPASRAPDILPAQPVGTTQLVNSNIPFNDYPEWSSGTTYEVGQRVIFSSSSIYVYEAIATSTGVNPVTDTTGKWLNIGAANRWRMFDSYLSTSTIAVDGDISVALRPGNNVDAIGLLNIKATTVKVTLTDIIEGEVLNRTYSLKESSLSESTWYSYFFENPKIYRNIFVIDDLPRFKSGVITIQLSYDGLPTECGLLVVGRKQSIGKGVEYGTTTGISDYSIKETDQFGNTNVVERAFADRINYRIFLDASDDYSVKNTLASVRAVPCLYVGNKDLQSTITYGYFKNFDIALQSPTYSDYNLEIEGLT